MVNVVRAVILHCDLSGFYDREIRGGAARVRRLPSLEELDQRLGCWERTVTVMVDNINELYEHPAYRALAGDSHHPAPVLTGLTRERVGAAVETVRDLLLCAVELNTVVRRAKDLRREMPRLLHVAKAVREIDALMFEPVVKMPALEVPLPQRGLLSESMVAGEKLTLLAMLEWMVPAFESSKRAILSVDSAWTRTWSALDAAETALAREEKCHRENGDCAGIPDAVLWEARGEISAWRVAAKTDPLAAADALTREILPKLQRAMSDESA